ncbi:Uncharacterised protein r2_g2674 [Pycnogonum litorale]
MLWVSSFPRRVTGPSNRHVSTKEIWHPLTPKTDKNRLTILVKFIGRKKRVRREETSIRPQFPAKCLEKHTFYINVIHIQNPKLRYEHVQFPLPHRTKLVNVRPILGWVYWNILIISIQSRNLK